MSNIAFWEGDASFSSECALGVCMGGCALPALQRRVHCWVMHGRACSARTAKKSAVPSATSGGRSSGLSSPSVMSSSREMTNVLPQSASSPVYGDQNSSSGGTSGSTCAEQALPNVFQFPGKNSWGQHSALPLLVSMMAASEMAP